MTSPPTPKERLLADILAELRAIRRELQAKPAPAGTTRVTPTRTGDPVDPCGTTWRGTLEERPLHYPNVHVRTSGVAMTPWGTPRIADSTPKMQFDQTSCTCEATTAHRGPAGEYRVGWQTPPHGYMHGEWVHK